MDGRREEPLLGLFLDVYVARLTAPVTTADVVVALQRLDVHCRVGEIVAALSRNPAVVRAGGRWHPRRTGSTRTSSHVPATPVPVLPRIPAGG